MAHEKHTWVDGETITKDLMNKLEEDLTALGDKYTLPAATSSALGGIKQGNKIESVSAENAGTIGAEFNQSEIQKIATLADATKTTVNKIIEVLQTSGVLSASASRKS